MEEKRVSVGRIVFFFEGEIEDFAQPAIVTLVRDPVVGIVDLTIFGDVERPARNMLNVSPLASGEPGSAGWTWPNRDK